MYDPAEEALGRLLPAAPQRERILSEDRSGLSSDPSGAASGVQPTFTGRGLFAATKVWTYGESAGVGQMEKSRALWGVARFDLMQVHNLMDWATHMKTLVRWKAEGKVRYIGVTTSHGRRHEELEKIIRTQPVDFVQFTYNFADRDAEPRLLAAARDMGKSVIINRPFDGGALFGRVRGKPLPAFAKDIGCANWAQFFLKWVIAHPAVTCAIPATSRVAHMRENMGALLAPLPDANIRKRMAAVFERL
jgi:diketogulonate reductase-like aldo/keto reductase